jgi:hypothetical protein
MMRKATATAAPRPKAGRVAPAEPDLRVGLGTASAVYFVLALIFFFPAFLPGEHIYGTDYLGGGYFFYHFISERLSAGVLPKWVPYVFGGLPLFANPGSTFHPVHFLADLVLPTPRVLPAVFVVQFWIAGVGMYLLARELGCRTGVALVAGLAYQFTGVTVSWVFAGHDGRIMVATVAPLFFAFLHRGIRTGRVTSFAGASAALALALLSFQIQNSYYMLLGGAIWGVFCLVAYGHARRPAALARLGALGLAAVALGFLLAAVNFLPFVGYVPESPRGMEGGRGYEFAVSFSMAPSELLAMAVPEHHGVSVAEPRTGRPLFPEYRGPNPFKLHVEYVGALVILLLVLGAIYSRTREWWFFAGLALFMLTIAFGGHTPLYRLYFELLPGTQRFRAPSLSFFIVVLSVVAMASIALERLLAMRDAEPEQRPGRSTQPDPFARLPWAIGAVAGLAVLGMLVTAGSAGVPGAPSVSGGWARFALFAALAGGALVAWARRAMSTRLLLVALAVVTVADLWVVGRKFFHTVDPPEAIFAADDVIQFLRAQPQPNRVWTFPYPEHYRGAGTYGGNFPMLFGIEQVGGEHPNMLQRWVEFVGPGTRTYIDWHNLIEDPQVVSTAEGQAIGFRSRPGFLEAANVRYIVSMAPLAHPALREVHRGSALVYEHTGALSRAFLVPEVIEVAAGEAIGAMRLGEWNPAQTAFVTAHSPLGLEGGPLEGEARIRLHEPDRIVVQATASRPALLVLADNHYEGWRAAVGGQDAEVLVVNHTFRGVVVPAGDHTVEFTFAPSALYTGLWISLAGLALLIALGGYAVLRRVRAREAAVEAA